MKTLRIYLAEGKVKQVSKDPAMARSLMQQAEARLCDLKQLPLTSENASFRFEGGYECLREAVQAFMARDGVKNHRSIDRWHERSSYRTNSVVVLDTCEFHPHSSTHQ